MESRALLMLLLTWVMYPVWLAAGAVDYLCHRHTEIHRTSGATESWLHIVQFLLLGCALAMTVFFEINLFGFAAIAVAVVLHSVFAYIDVRYTVGRRFISPVEQWIHGFLDTIPLFAVALIAVIHWPDLSGDAPVWFRMRSGETATSGWLLLGSFLVFAGFPILEEFVRTVRGARKEKEG